MLEAKKDLDEVLTHDEREAIKKENVNGNYSYRCLMNEMLFYRHMTVRQLLNGWGGVKLFKI